VSRFPHVPFRQAEDLAQTSPRVFTLSSHTPESLLKILQNALINVPQPTPRLPDDLLPFLADVADGDARQALNGLELALKVCQAPQQSRLDASGTLTNKDDEQESKKSDQELMEAVKRGLRKGYDRSGEERYDMISALHKCLRGSDGSAAMYWLARWVLLIAEGTMTVMTCRMLTGGEDPLYIARRLVVVASEDVGLADPHGLPLVSSA
jgi:putative ATPase